ESCHLKQEAKAKSCSIQFRFAQLRQISTIKQDTSQCWTQESNYKLQSHSLSTTGLTDDADGLTSRDSQSNVAQDFLLAEANGDPLEHHDGATGIRHVGVA